MIVGVFKKLLTHSGALGNVKNNNLNKERLNKYKNNKNRTLINKDKKLPTKT